MGKSIYALFFLFFPPLLFAGQVKVSIKSACVKNNTLAYDIEIKNISDTELMLTDINGSYYSINNGYVYVELYAHNPFLHSYPMEEQSPLSGDFKLMNPGEKIRIQKKYVLKHYEYNNFKLGYDFKMEDPNLKVEFLIGYFKETSCGKNNQYV